MRERGGGDAAACLPCEPRPAHAIASRNLGTTASTDDERDGALRTCIGSEKGERGGLFESGEERDILSVIYGRCLRDAPVEGGICERGCVIRKMKYFAKSNIFFLYM